MVFSRSDVKRKTKEVHDPLGENPKRTKVHAQRKFAQGSGMNSPIMTPIKEKEKTKPNGAPSPAELLPSKRPTTEDFLSFLCFRGTKVLPPRLDFFNEASSSERSDNVTQTNSSKQTAASPSGVQKIKPRNAGTQVFKKALADRQSGLQKGNAMRARTASDERQTIRKNRIERQLRRKAAQIRAKTIRKTHPSILKRLGANRLRAGLRSGGQLPPGSEVGLKTDRKPKRGRPKRPRIKKKMDSVPQKRLKREEEANNDESEESISEEEFQEEQSGDEETEEADKKPLKKSSMTMRTRGSSNSPAQSPKKQGVSSRPSRKTKEAATLYMEMITKDLRNPEEDDDDDDEDYVRNFPELPSVIKKEKEDEAKQRSPKRVKQEKRPSSPNKSDRGKAVKNEKVKEEDDEDNEPLLKRSQRLLQVKRISPKGKTNTKFRGRPKLKGSQIKKGEEPPKNTKDFLKKRGNRKRESKNTSDSIIDDDEEEDEGNDSSLNSRNRKGNAESSNLSKSRYSRRSDIKKNDEMNESMKDISSKKRKSTPATLSEEIDLSEEDDNIELSGSSKKVRRSADEVVETKKAKSTDQRKTKKSSIDLKQVESISKRVSTRNIKKELNESECEEEDPKEKPTTRAKRIKNESDDDVPARKSKAGRRKIKYKEETDEEQDEDEEEEEEEETPVKLRGHLQRKAKIKDEIDDIQEKNVKKYNQTQQPRAKSKDESDEEAVSYSKKDRESLQRRVKNRIDNEVEFDNPVKKTREPSQRKAKNSGSENDKNNELAKLREPAQRKQKIKEESDEENEITHKKTRESSQRKVKYSYESEEEAEKIPKKLREPLERKVKNKEEESDEEIDVAPKKSRESLQRRVKNKEVSDDEITNVRKQRSSVQRKSKIKDDSDEEEIISVKKTRGSLQRKTKAKVDSDEEFDEPNPTKTREHLQRKSKNKEDYNETPQNLVDDSPSSEEDEDENAGSLRESSARKLLNRDQIKDNKTKRREQLRKSKSKSDDTESQEKMPHEVLQKTLKGKVKIEGVQSDFKKNDQQQKNISSKEQTSSKENIVDSDDNSVNLPQGSLDSNKKDEDLNEKKTDKARVQQKRAKSCTSGSETVEGKSEDVHGLTESVGKTKKVINLGQNKDSNLEVDENVNEARKEGERSLLVDEEIEKSSKANVKNKGKKSASMNESELQEHIVKEELKQQKSKTNTSSETVASIQDDQFQSKTRTSMKDNELEDNGIKEGNSFCKEVAIKSEKESMSDKQPKEFARLNKSSSKNTLSENIEEQNTQKTRTMPRRGSRKGYEESDDESDDFKIQGKQSSKMATRNENFENISDSESDGKCRGLKVIEPEEKDLLKTNELQKKNRKSVPVNKIKKEFNEEEVNKLKVKGDEITLSSTQEEPVTSVKNEPEVPDKMFKNKNDKYIVTRNIKTEDSAAQIVEDDIAGIKQTQERELIQKDSLQKREIGTPNGDFCSQRKVETLKLDGNEQDIHQATVMKVKVEEGLKNVHEHSHKMIKEQNEAILDKKNAEKGFDDQRKISKKAKAVSNENSDGKTKFDRSSIVDYDTGQVNFSFESNLANKSNEENIESNIEVKPSTDEIAQKSSSRSGTDKINIKKGNDIDRRKFKKSSSDAALPEPRRKSRDSDRKLSKKNDEFSDVGEIKERKLDLSPEDKYKLKRSTRFSTGNHEDKLIVKISDRDSYFADIDKTLPFDRSDSSPIPPRTSVRKPSLNARAIEREDVRSNDLAKVPASIKRKSVGERDSCDTIGSGSSGIVDCKVVLEALGNIPSDSYKHSKKIKNSDKHASGKTVGTKTGEESLVKSKNSSIPNKPSCLETSETLPFEVKKEISEKQVSKPSISETWRQAFKNAKIPKPGHLSPVQHSVKPFVRQKLPGSPLLSTTFQGKGSDGTETKAQEVNKSKVTSSLSPFKSLIANQNQRSLSPDAKRHSSPAHKVGSAGYESPLRRNDDIKVDFRKQEAPVKSLTQLQYEKRSSEFISSLESGPPVLPGFESIRAYKKEMKKEEPKEIKTEVLDPPAPPEAIVKPSTEGKHLNLPLAVEHTLRKMSPITVSKKPPAKPITVKTETLPLTKPVPPTVACEKKIAVEPVPSPAPVNPSPSGQLGPPNDLTIRDSSDLSFLAKKKVNMTAEEIERWLSDSTSNGVEHKKDCGIFENNQCECSYRTSGASMQNSVGTSELVAKDDGKIDHGVVEPPVQLKELDKHGKYVAETISTCKVEEYKEKLLSKTNVSENKMAPPKSWKSSGQEKFKSNRSMTEEEMCEYDFRFDKMSNSPRESVSDVSSVTHRDDASSSSEVPERKIFHQKRERCRDAPGPKRPSISSPTAFSAENESSVYAFKPDPPSHTNRPFRRGRGKSGEPDDRKGMSSSSVAVQVNLKESLESESEAVLECSTQTERPNDDNEGHLFYIPLPDEQLQSGLPHGVAVKLDTEGPDQRVIMRAKLVTKPSSSFPPAYNSRSLVTSSRSNHQKPEQKVRPLWSGSGKAPFVAVPPTMREPQTSDQGTTTNQEKKPQQPEKSQVAQTSQSTQINQGSSKGPESPRSRSSSKAQKQSETLPPPPSSPPTAIEWKGTEFPPPDIPATLVEAPTFYPSEKDFQDPLEYIEQLTPLAQSFGICRIVPPSSFKPECKVSDDMRFTAYNQYVHKMMERWGPNVRELCAIRKYLATQSITLVQLPMIGSMEVDLPRLYQTVQQCGGLKEVIEKKRWAKVADAMRIPKSAQDRVTKLDDIYCKYLLPYDTLSHEERTKLLEEADEEWKEREKRLASDEDSGNNGSGEGSDESSEADDNIFECITKGKSMPLSVFFRIARNTMATWFKDTSPSPSEVEAEFWRHVSTKTCHVCVHCGSIDSGTWGYGFPTTKTSSTSRHPWNLKVLTNSPGSILRSLGPLMGVTVPTLHVGMLFSSCCWYRDPHALPWIEYLHTGASKIWYGVPDSRASELRKAMYPLLPRHIRDRKIWLPSDTMMVPPQFLLDGGVSLCRVVQEPGQFILVFPKAFTSSICTGYLVSESVYFAQPSWLNTAVQVFKDIQESCEPPVFSLDKLLFSIANDSRSSADILIQVLPMLKAAIEKEVESRKKLRDLGLTSWERLPSHKSGRRKKKEEEQSDMECDTCRGSLFLSVVSNSNEDCSYCIDHAIESLTKDQSLVKYCKPMFAYDEEEMEELVDKVKARIETKTQKKQKEKGVSSGTKN